MFAECSEQGSENEFFRLVSIEDVHIPGAYLCLVHGLLRFEVFNTLFGYPFSGHDDLRIKLKIEGDIWAWERGFEYIGMSAPQKKWECVLVLERKVFELNEAIKEGTIRQEVVIPFLFECGVETSEAEYIEEKECLAEQEGKERSASNSLFMAWLEVFDMFESTYETVDQ